MIKALLGWWPVDFIIHSERGELGDDWKEALPEEMRGAPELVDIKDITGLVSSFVHLKKGAGDWKSSLMEELAKDPSIAPIKDINSMVKSFIHAQKMIGANKVAIPGKNATPDEWKDFYIAAGRPETPDAYTIPKPKDPKGGELEADKQFRETVHTLGFSDAQTNGLYKYLTDAAEKEFKATEEYFIQQHAEAEAGLKKEWGAAYDKKIAAARRLVEAFGDDALKTEMKESGLDNNIALIKMFEKIGNKLLEDNLIGDGTDTSLSPSEAKTKSDAIKNDKSHPYHQKGKPGHAEAVAEMQRLYELMYPAAEAHIR